MHAAVSCSGRAAVSTSLPTVCPGRPATGVRRNVPLRAAASSAVEYAVIEFNGRKHWLTEGSSFAVCKRALEEKVLALRQAGELLKGRPYVDGAVVEGRLEDEFRAPTVWSSMSMASHDVDTDDEEGTQPERTLRRILITRIQG